MKYIGDNSSKGKILKAAYKLFRHQGVGHSGLNQILQNADAGKSQMYHYFKDKDELVRQVVMAYANKIFIETAKFMNEIESLQDFEKLISGTQRLCKSDNQIVGCLIGSLGAEMSAHREEVRLEIQNLVKQWEALFSKGLVRLQAKGILNEKAKTDQLAEFFLSNIQGAMLVAKITQDLSVIRRSVLHSILYLETYKN